MDKQILKDQQARLIEARDAFVMAEKELSKELESFARLAFPDLKVGDEFTHEIKGKSIRRRITAIGATLNYDKTRVTASVWSVRLKKDGTRYQNQLPADNDWEYSEASGWKSRTGSLVL